MVHAARVVVVSGDGSFATKLVWRNDSLTRTNPPDSTFQCSLVRVYRWFSQTRRPSLTLWSPCWVSRVVRRDRPGQRHEALLSWKELSWCCVDRWTVCMLVWERGRSWVWLSQLRTGHPMIHRYRKHDWTNKQTILNGSSWRTDWSKLNQAETNPVPRTQYSKLHRIAIHT